MPLMEITAMSGVPPPMSTTMFHTLGRRFGPSHTPRLSGFSRTLCCRPDKENCTGARLPAHRKALWKKILVARAPGVIRLRYDPSHQKPYGGADSLMSSLQFPLLQNSRPHPAEFASWPGQVSRQNEKGRELRLIGVEYEAAMRGRTTALVFSVTLLGFAGGIAIRVPSAGQAPAADQPPSEQERA